MENHNIALDLVTARRKAGLLQVDCAHLLDIHPTRVSMIESGKSQPTIEEAAALSLIYGMSLDSFLAGLRDELVDHLVQQLTTLPPVSENRKMTFNRAHTLSQLAIRLEALADAQHGAA